MNRIARTGWIDSWFLALALVLSSLAGGDATARPLDPDPEYARLTKQVSAALAAGRFAELDVIANEERTQKSRFADGRWKLNAFYDGMHPFEPSSPNSVWSLYHDRLTQWVDRSGNVSPTPHVALASYYEAVAWRERGEDAADSVTPEGWRGYRRNLQLAQTELNNSASISKRCPEWFDVMQEVALGQGWTDADYEKLFEEAASREPTYYFYYFQKANFYQSRWYGSTEKLMKFVDDAVARSYQSEGLTLYARIYWSASREFGDDMFAPGNVDWTKMKAGFESMNRQYPDSNWNMNAFAHFACMAGDRAAARQALSKIGDRIAAGAWSSDREIDSCKRWSAVSA